MTKLKNGAFPELLDICPVKVDHGRNCLYSYYEMQKNTAQDKAVKEYEENSTVILQKMLMVLVRAHRKIDDQAYLKALQKLEKYE